MAIREQAAGFMMRGGVVTLMLLIAAVSSSSAEDYAVNITVTTDTSSATLTWTAADNSTADSYIIEVLQDTTNLDNYTISDVNTVTYTVSNLVYSTYYTVNLHTLDGSAQELGVSTISFWTAYFALNGKFIAALAVLGFIIGTLVVMMVLKMKCLNSDSASDEEPVLDEEKAEEPEEEHLEEKKTQDVRKNEDIVIF